MFPPQDGGEERERQEGKEERRRETTEEKIKKGPPSAESPAGKMKAILRVVTRLLIIYWMESPVIKGEAVL